MRRIPTLSTRLTLSPLRRMLRSAVYGSAIYDFSLRGRVPPGLKTIPPESRLGDPETAAAILQGVYVLNGRKMPLGESPWSQFVDGEAAEALHGFGWLRDLWALGSENASRLARRLTGEWINTHGRWDALTWRADVAGDRLANWLAAYPFLDRGADAQFREAFFNSAARQTRHLGRVIKAETHGAGRLLAIKGLIYGGACLSSQEAGADQGIPQGIHKGGALALGLKLLKREIASQILPDGGHFQRNPTQHLLALSHLVDIRATLAAARLEVPPDLQSALDRMPPMLRAWRHGDGRLALFNGGNEGVQQEIDTVLAQAGPRGKPLVSAPHTGFYRLAAGRTLVIMDVGGPPPREAGPGAHAGALSFEMSLGKERLVVNCGAAATGDGEWRTALRATAAHSTLSVDDTNSATVLPSGVLVAGPTGVTSTRKEEDGNTWVESLHDGYLNSLGLIHHRDLYLSVGGDDLRGRDKLTGKGGKNFAIRFHLHPRVQTSMTRDGTSALLRLPGGVGWRFLASGGQIAIEESVYGGMADGHRRRCEQIVVSGSLEGNGVLVKWAFRREGGGK